MKTPTSLIAFALLFLNSVSHANEVHIDAASFYQQHPKQWRITVTLSHDDTGWQHYADGWRVVDEQGQVLAHRTLLHPHVNEQPFTRGLSNVEIPTNSKIVFIEAHDTVHGWAKQRLLIDLNRANNGKLEVTAR